MQKSYILDRALHFTADHFYGKGGDVIVHTPPTQAVAYRNGSIVANLTLTQVSLDGMLRSGILREDKVVEPAAAVEVVTEEVEVVTPAAEEVEVVTPAAEEVEVVTPAAEEVVAEVKTKRNPKKASN